jgi:hypothetical protein
VSPGGVTTHRLKNCNKHQGRNELAVIELLVIWRDGLQLLRWWFTALHG